MGCVSIPDVLENRYSANDDNFKLQKQKVDLSNLKAVRPMHAAFQKDKFKTIGNRLAPKLKRFGTTMSNEEVVKATPSIRTSSRSGGVSSILHPKSRGSIVGVAEATKLRSKVFIHRQTHKIDPIFTQSNKRVI
jgi:hypothetical protein